MQTIGSRIFATYAKQDADAADEIHGQGKGFVDAYDTSGNLVARVAQHGQLDAPWGLALAPAISAPSAAISSSATSATARSTPTPSCRTEGSSIAESCETPAAGPSRSTGLWALQFGHAAPNNGPTNTLFFTAGPNDESDGLFGTITRALIQMGGVAIATPPSTRRLTSRHRISPGERANGDGVDRQRPNLPRMRESVRLDRRRAGVLCAERPPA